MFFAICFLIILVVFLLLLLNTTKPNRYPPGPKWWPIVGNLLEYRREVKRLGFTHLAHQMYAKKYGNVVGHKMGRLLVVVVSGSDAVKEVLTREEFNGRPDGYFFRLRTFGKRLGVAFSEGPFWRKQRKFSIQHLRNFGLGRKEMEEKIQEEARELIAMFKEKCSEPMWMHKSFTVSVLNVLWAMMAGFRFEINDARLLKLLDIIDEGFRSIDMSGGMLNQLPFLRFVAPEFCGYNKHISILERSWNFLEEAISEHKRTLSDCHTRDFIDAFLQKMNMKTDSTFTNEQLLSLCLDLLMAGSETTSNTLGFGIIFMLQYPEVQKKVQKELDEVVGRNRWPLLQDRVNLKYTEAVLMEMQRRTTVPPLGIAHRANCDAELFGYFIPEGTILLTSLYSVNMESSFWKDPHEFRPERFLDEKGDLASIDERHFAPFGIGQRRCLGESLAKACYFTFLTTLLHNFNLEYAPGEARPTLEGYDGVTVSPKPFKAKLVLRSD